MKTATAVLACLAACAVYIPAAFVIGRNHIPAPCPEGFVVEKTGGFRFSHPDHRFVRSHIVRPDRFADTSGIADCQALTVPTDFAVTPDLGDVNWFETGDGDRQPSNEGHHWHDAVGAEDVLNIALALSALYVFVRLVMFGIKR